MAPPAPPADAGPEAPALLDDAFRDVLDAIDAPALIFLPGGRIAAVNRAMARLAGGPTPGETIGAVIDRLRARRADGSPLVRGDSRTPGRSAARSWATASGSS